MYYIIIALIITIFFISLGIYIIHSYIDFPFLDYEKTTCKYSRFGCCKDKLTSKYDQDGTNCRGF